MITFIICAIVLLAGLGLRAFLQEEHDMTTVTPNDVGSVNTDGRLTPMTVLRISAPFGGDLPGDYSIHDDHWTVTGDLRQIHDLDDESMNNVVSDRLRAEFDGVVFDSEFSCFFAFAPSEKLAQEVLEAAVAEAILVATGGAAEHRHDYQMRRDDTVTGGMRLTCRTCGDDPSRSR